MGEVTEEVELLPCPFCGTTDVSLHYGLLVIMEHRCDDNLRRPTVRVEGQTKAQAVAAWNTRAAPLPAEKDAGKLDELGEPKKAFSETFRAATVLKEHFFAPEDAGKLGVVETDENVKFLCALHGKFLRATRDPFFHPDYSSGETFSTLGSDVLRAAAALEKALRLLSQAEARIAAAEEHAQALWEARYVDKSNEKIDAIRRAERAEARLAEAEKVLNLIDALDPEEHLYGVSHDACRGLVARMGAMARAFINGAAK